ncbi:MAG: hypothetical protein HFE60_05125 [Anaerotignum sp.]|nr:hypothetical protein [Anaerotignum sp.]
MRKCVPCASDRMITALAVIVCAAAAILAFRQLLCGEQPPAVFLSVGILFSGVAVRTLWQMSHVGSRGFFYDDEKIIFALSRRDRREFLWDELRNAQENAKIRIFCQSFPEAWYFYFPDKKKIRQLAAIPRMEGYDGLASMLRKKEIPAGKTTGRSAASEKEWLGQIYHEIYGEHLDKDDRGKR